MNYNDLCAKEDAFLKKHGNIYISDEQNVILKKYNIDVEKFKDISELIFDIETLLSDSFAELQDLEWVAETLSEFNYYNNTNK